MRSFRRSLRRLLALLGALAIGAGVVGCSSGSTSLEMHDPWIRPPTAPGAPAAGYLTIANTGTARETLVGARSAIATSVEVHETSTDGGMAGMHPIDRLEIEPGATVTLEPGGYHLMLMGVQALVVGDTVEITLEFEKSGPMTIEFVVREG